MKRLLIFEGILAIALVILLFLAYLMVTEGDKVMAGQWNTTNLGRIDFMSVSNDSLYAFSANSITCMDENGEVKWTYRPAHADDTIIQGGYSWVYDGDEAAQYIGEQRPIFAVDNDTLYLYIIRKSYENRGEVTIPGWAGLYYQIDNHRTYEKRIVAISGGEELWSYSIDEPIGCYDPDSITAKGGRVYFHHFYNETVLDGNGTPLFNISGTSDPAAIDDGGNIYIVDARPSDSPVRYLGWTGFSSKLVMERPYFETPSNVIRSYFPNGTLRWEKHLSEDACRQYVQPDMRGKFDSLPIYDHGAIYVPTASGIISLDLNGSVQWEKTFNDGNFSLLEAMPFDDEGNIYMRHLDDAYMSHNSSGGTYVVQYPSNERLINYNSSYIYVIAPDGRSVSLARPFDYSYEQVSARNGILYTSSHVNASHGGLMTEEITASDLVSGKTLWKYKVPVKDVRTSQNTSMNIHYTTFDPMPDPSDPILTSIFTMRSTYKGAFLGVGADVYPGDDNVYVDFASFRGELPLVDDQANSSYSMGIYALDNRGDLLWYKPMDSRITSVAVNNSTIYYGTESGKLSSATIEIAAGLALAAISYLFIRFFLLGAISRARDRLGVNENRNKVLEYVKAHPGSTLSEASRDLRMNLGTVKYHALILGINHRIMPVKGDRFVRYFTNAGSYSGDERLILSLLRRDGVKKALNVLLEKPGLSNAQLSRELGISETAAGKTMKVLLDHHIVVREPVDGRTSAYSIDTAYKESVTIAMERLGGQ